MSSDIGTEAETEAEAEVVRQFRAVAGGAAQPSSERLYAGAVERGRRIRRARVIWRMLVGAAVVGVVAAAGIPLLGTSSSSSSTDGTATTEAAAPSTAGATATPGAAHTRPAAAAGSDTSWMRSYTTQTFESLLPAGYSTAPWSQFGGVPFHVAAPLLGVNGTWEARVMTDLTTGAGRSTTGLSVRASGTKAVCPSKVGAPYDTCTTVARDGGTVVVDLSFKNPVNGSGAKIWTVDWNGPDGRRVSFSEATAEPHQALTVQQAVSLVTSPAWDRVWQALPAACPDGAMIRPGATNAQLQDGTGLVCATSRSVAVPH